MVSNQKEGNGNIDIIFALSDVTWFTSGIFHHTREKRREKGGGTYTNDSWVIGHGWRLVLLDAGVLLNSKILHIASSENDVLVDLIRGRNLLLWSAFSTFGSERSDILEGYC